jgi:hypothetical protein
MQIEVAEIVKALAEQTKYYTQDTAPCGSNPFLKAAKRGAFRTFRPGKKLLALRSEVDSWIESNEVTPGIVDDVDALLAAGGVQRAAA